MTVSALAPIFAADHPDAPVSWQAGGLAVGTSDSADAVSLSFDQVYHWWPLEPSMGFNYPHQTYRTNPTEAAFKIVGTMMERGLIGELTVASFVALVNDVAEIVRTT